MRANATSKRHVQVDPKELDQVIGWFTGIDADTIAAADALQTRACLKKIERLLARERNKGVARHWAYDFNRHITLKRARDRLVALLEHKSMRWPLHVGGAKRRRLTS